MIVYILFPSCSLPRLDTPVNFTRKHRRAFQCAELSVVSENNRALTQSVPPKKVYIEYIYIYKGFFFGGGLFVLFFVLGGFLLRLCQNPVAFSKFNVRSCTNVLSFEHDDIQIEFFYKTNFTLYKDIALFHSSLTLFFCFETKQLLNVEYLQMSLYVRNYILPLFILNIFQLYFEACIACKHPQNKV